MDGNHMKSDTMSDQANHIKVIIKTSLYNTGLTTSYVNRDCKEVFCSNVYSLIDYSDIKKPLDEMILASHEYKTTIPQTCSK